MRHKNRVKKLGVDYSHRKAMVANIVASLVIYERITTTKARARVCLANINKAINLARVTNSREKVNRIIKDKIALDKVFDVFVQRYKDKKPNESYVKLYTLGNRSCDDAKLVRLIMVGTTPVVERKKVRVKKNIKKQKEAEKTEVIEKKEDKNVFKAVKRFTDRFSGIGKKGDKQKETTKKIETKTRSGI